MADGMHLSTCFFTLNLFYGMVPIVVLLVVQVYNCLHVLGVSGKNKCPNNIPSGHGHRPTAWYVLGHCIVVGFGPRLALLCNSHFGSQGLGLIGNILCR